jgi:hypothetical protein
MFVLGLYNNNIVEEIARSQLIKRKGEKTDIGKIYLKRKTRKNIFILKE